MGGTGQTGRPERRGFPRVIFLLLIPILLMAQQTLSDFQQQVEPYYAFLSRSSIKNFSCLITTSSYIDYIKERADSTYFYPLKFIWLREGKAYYILRPLPPYKDARDRQEILTHIQEVKQVFQGILLDWQKYALDSPVASLSPAATFQRKGDSLIVEDHISANQQDIHIQRIYTPAGLLVQDVWESGDLRIVNFPVFQTVEKHWVCIGWQSQIYRSGQVSSGMAVGMEVARIGGQWLPVRFRIVVQTAQKPGEKAVTMVYLKAYQYNETLEILQKKEGATTPPSR